MDALESLVSTVAGWVWGPPMLILLVGTGLYLTILLRGMQFRVLPYALKLILQKELSQNGDISHFAALMTALSATVGIGNIVGVAAAITRASSTLAVTVAVAPIPLSDLALLAPLQAVLVTSIAYLSGRRWDRKTAVEWIGGVGVVGAAGFGLRWGAQQAVKVLPGLGSVVSAC